MSTDITKKFRTIFISDVHLGTRGCQAEMLIDFLNATDADKIYLIGDIVDVWQIGRNCYWPNSHTLVVQTLLAKAKTGAEVIYVPGNHDSFLRRYCGTHFAGVEVKMDDMHETANGKKYFICHGDAFDGVILYARWLALVGHVAYGTALRLNTAYNAVRKWCGMEYWSLSAWLKFKVKNAVKFITQFEEALCEEAERRGADGVICGHIHHAEQRDINGIEYVNDGDWVESCSALVEHSDGSLELINWAEEIRRRHQKLPTPKIEEVAA